MKEKILIVEDQFIEANNLQMILERAGYEVCGIARSVARAQELLSTVTPDLVLLDIFLQGPLTGIDLAVQLKEQKIAFVYLSANSNKKTLDMAKATHPYGFLVKPFREKDVLVMLEIARYLHLHNMQSMLDKAPATVLTGTKPLPQVDNFRGIIGKSRKLQQVINLIRIVAPVDTSVLILGESGTGKERVATCIHELSLRNKRPLIKVNCATMQSDMVESLLFGHEKGAYTGAAERRIGRFEQADKGTLFLDEIGELTPDLQIKLLRVLQEKEIERLGGSETIKVDVRIIAATNRDLEKEVAEGRFRMDLYYRLNVFPVTVPPLRERTEDISLLVRHFIEYYCRKIGRPLLGIADNVMADLITHHWAGNIRELEHTIERSILLTQGNTIHDAGLPAPAALSRDNKPAASVRTMEEAEREHIIAVLKQCNGKISGTGGAAALLGMPSSTLNSRIKKLGITKVSLIC